MIRLFEEFGPEKATEVLRDYPDALLQHGHVTGGGTRWGCARKVRHCYLDVPDWKNRLVTENGATVGPDRVVWTKFMERCYEPSDRALMDHP
jgi:hypothetical protein